MEQHVPDQSGGRNGGRPGILLWLVVARKNQEDKYATFSVATITNQLISTRACGGLLERMSLRCFGT
jgi:hypothetical protein